jgi:hypothetical protein
MRFIIKVGKPRGFMDVVGDDDDFEVEEGEALYRMLNENDSY